MGKKQPYKETDQAGGITDKRDKNAGSGAFNQGSEQDPDLDRGVADGIANPDKVSREKENPKAKSKKNNSKEK